MCATYDSSVTLENKNSTTWEIIDDDVSATVDFNSSGDEFEWHVYGCVGLEPAGCYYLIYYGDERNDRFTNYGGGYPGAVITHFSPDGCGEFDKSGATELDMNLPSYPDGNMDVYDYSGAPDYYDPGCGAKLWIVPCDCYDTGSCSFYPNWNPEDYLFDTSLIWYDDIGVNEKPEIVNTGDDGRDYYAGDEPGVVVSARICDNDGVGDLESMVVTANYSQHGIDELVTMEFVEMINCTCAYYESEPVVITQSTCECHYGEYYRSNGNGFDCEQVDVEIVATDSSGEYDDATTDFYVYPGSCASLKIEDYNEGAGDKALTQLWWCYGYSCDWYWDNDYELYYLQYIVFGYDEYGNCIGPINHIECCDCFTATVDSPASLEYYGGSYQWWNSNYIVVYNEESAAEVTLRVHCVGNDNVEDDELTINFLQPVSWLEVSSDVDFVYTSDECGEECDCYNVTAQIMDAYGDPIPMPGVEVRLFVNTYLEGIDETDDNGTVTFVNICSDNGVAGSIIDVRCEAECREGILTIDVVDPVLSYIEICPEEPEMECGDTQKLEYSCWTDHNTQMCCPECPPATWTCNEFGEVDEDGYLTALDSGVAVVTTNVSGVIGTVDIVINCPKNCTVVDNGCFPYAFVVNSGSVSISGNLTEPGYACVKALGDPIPEWDNDTKGAITDTSENTTLDLNGTGDIWVCNETTGNWVKYANGDTAEISSGRGMYALVTPGDLCAGVTCDNVCRGYHLWSYKCVDGECVADKLIESNSAQCGYSSGGSSSGGSSGSSSGGTYPPNWDKPKDTGSSNTTQVTVPTPTPTDAPESPTRPNASTIDDGSAGMNDSINDTDADPTPTPESPGFGVIFVVLGVLAVAYLIGRKRA